jgi:hypothetical protein
MPSSISKFDLVSTFRESQTKVTSPQGKIDLNKDAARERPEHEIDLGVPFKGDDWV